MALGARRRARPAVYSLVIRLGMPESVRFLEKQGRTEEAERVVRSFEASAGIQHIWPRSHLFSPLI